MDKILKKSLDQINEGVMILDKDLKIIYLNQYMLLLLNQDAKEVLYSKLYQVIPTLDEAYFKRAINGVINNGCKVLFSANSHKNIIPTEQKLNLKISKLEAEVEDLIMFEFMDISTQFFQIQELKKLAYYDQLTQVANRTLFYKIARKVMCGAKQQVKRVGVMYIDLNKFKSINDTYGHEVGDQVLIHVADRLKKMIGKGDMIARYGGDEFLVLLPHIKSLDHYNEIASQMKKPISMMVKGLEKDIKITSSIGVSFYPEDGETLEELIIKADQRMYEVKRQRS